MDAIPTSSVVCASETATPGTPRRAASSAARALPSPTMSRAFQASIQSTGPASASNAVASPRPSEPRNRSNGWAMPTRPPCSRTAAIASAARQAGRDRLAQEHADQVAGLRPDLLADDDGQAGRLGRRAVTRLEGAVDPVVVGDREVRQAARRRGADDRRGRGQRVEARRGVAVQVEECAPCDAGTGSGLTAAAARPRCSGRATS